MSYPTAMKLRVYSIWFKKFLSSCQLCVFRTADPVCRESAGHQWLPSQGTSIAGALIYSYIFALACCWMNNKTAGEYQWMDDYTMGQKGWDDIYSGYMLKNSRTWCDCLLHGELHSSDMKVSDKHVYVYLYLTNNYVFVSTCQNNNVLRHNITTKHWWDMSSLQQKSAVFQSHYTM